MPRQPASVHTRQPWRIHEIAPDFRVEDVWSFRTPGARAADFSEMISAVRATGAPGSSTRLTRALFALRWRLGAMFGWDGQHEGLGARVAPLRGRLPQDLRETAAAEPADSVFTPLYRAPHELASELANRTVHTVMHLGWVAGPDGYELRMAVLVRPNGIFGRLYMAAIAPFRFLIVYPAMTRQWESAWLRRATLDGKVDAWRDAEITTVLPGMAGVRADAMDAVSIHTTVQAPPSAWARAVLEDGLGQLGQVLWRRVLRLRLAPQRDDGAIAGWRISRLDERFVMVEAHSSALSARLVVACDSDSVVLASFIQTRSRFGRALWTMLRPVHRRVTAKLLGEAPGRVLARQSGPNERVS